MLQHVALIMDGNRRWAKKKKLPTLVGHKRGYEQIEKIVKRAKEHRIPYITFWAFSTENWHRSKEEVSYLMNLFRGLFTGKMLNRLLKENVKFCVIGTLSAFPEDIQKEVAKVVAKSKNNTGIQVNIALSYGGREEIVQAIQQIVSENIKKDDITEELFSQYLYTKDIPDPDLIVRTGGALRLSGYLLWQSTYSELYFVDTFWPDFDEEAFDKAIEEFKNRERRFGK